MIAGLSFLHPALLWGLALGALPILLHLLQRRRYRVRRWAAMEFLRTSVRQSSRRLRIEQWLLLAVRALILMLAALALTRPVWRSPRWSWLGSRAAAQVVIVLDDSYSMGWRSSAAASGRAASTQYEWGRARALELVHSGLTPGDAVSVVLASQPARAVVRRPTFNLREVADRLRRAPLSDRGTDLAGAARLCLEILRSGRSAAREVYLISDLQAAAWRRPDVLEAWRRVAGAGRLHLLGTAPAQGANRAVEEVRVDPLVTTSRVSPIQARIVNWGSQPARGVMVTLHVDGRPVASTRADLPAGGSAEARFEHAFPTPGAHRVMVSLPEDLLPVDDRAYASILAQDRVRVLVLDGRPDPDPRHDAAFFVTAALAPGSGAGSSSPFALQRIEGSSFRGADLSRQDVVILADVPRLSTPERRALARFAADGGGVLILPGPSALAAFYNGDLLNQQPALMPARLGAARDAGSAAPALDLAHVDHPVLNRFRGAADVDLSTARFTRYFRLQALSPATGARVACRFTDGAPALVERPVGLGRVSLLASPLSPDWNTLPFKPAFLPFLHGLVAYLGQGANRSLNVRVGEPLVWALPEDDAGAGAWTLERPDGRRVPLQPQRSRDPGDPGRLVRLDSAPWAGLYRLLSSKAGQGATQVWFAANLDPAESDLRALSRRELESRFRPAAFRWVDPHESIASVVQEGRQGREAWRGLLLAAVALMLCESGMAQWFGRRRSYV